MTRYGAPFLPSQNVDNFVLPFNTPRSTYSNSRPYLLPNVVLAVDAGDTVSYPGTGTTWTDLSGSNNNGSFVGSITFQNVNGGVLQTSNNQTERLAQVLS